MTIFGTLRWRPGEVALRSPDAKNCASERGNHSGRFWWRGSASQQQRRRVLGAENVFLLPPSIFLCGRWPRKGNLGPKESSNANSDGGNRLRARTLGLESVWGGL